MTRAGKAVFPRMKTVMAQLKMTRMDRSGHNKEERTEKGSAGPSNDTAQSVLPAVIAHVRPFVFAVLIIVAPCAKQHKATVLCTEVSCYRVRATVFVHACVRFCRIHAPLPPCGNPSPTLPLSIQIMPSEEKCATRQPLVASEGSSHAVV